MTTRDRVLAAAAAGFFLGVFMRSELSAGLFLAAFLALMGCAALGLFFLDGRKSAAAVSATALLFMALGIMRMDAASLHGDPLLSVRLATVVTLEGTVSADPDVREGSTRISLGAEHLVGATSSLPVAAGVLVLLSGHSDVAYGDRVRASGTLRVPQSFEAGAGREFDYPGYLAASGIAYELGFAKVERQSGGGGNPLERAALGVKHLYLGGLGRALPEPQAGLGGGITAGDKRGIGEELSQVFRTVGLVHVVVLSGYNITIVMSGAAHVLSRFGASRALGFGTSGLIALFFILMSGGAASAARAGAMALIAVYARATGRLFIAWRVLVAVAVAMVAWNPYLLAFDPGFQLSVLATAGLILFTPIAWQWLPWVPEKLGLREIAASTVGTQLMVLPLLLYQNGQLPIYSLPANLLALSAVPWAMLFSSIASLAGLALGPLAPLIAFPAYVLLAYIIGVAEFFGSLPFAALTLPAFSAWWLAGAYALLFAGWHVINKAASSTRAAKRRDIS